MTRALLRDRKGGVAVEFALVAPTFLMIMFLILDGGRLMFAKQSLNELTVATARCAAIQATGCDTAANAKSWAVSRGNARSAMNIANSNVTVTTSTSCNGVANMTKVTITRPWANGAMGLLPGHLAPTSLSSSSCFPEMG